MAGNINRRTEYFVIRRKKDKLCYGKNVHYKTTGNHLPRHGFDPSFPPFLYSTIKRAMTAIAMNYELITTDVEIMRWPVRAMQKVNIEKAEKITIAKDN